MKRKNILLKTFITTYFVFPLATFAAADATLHNPLVGGTDIKVIINTALGYITTIGGIIATFAFIYSGFLFVKARGSETGLDEAKEFFKGTVIGTLILVGAAVIGEIIQVTITSLHL